VSCGAGFPEGRGRVTPRAWGSTTQPRCLGLVAYRDSEIVTKKPRQQQSPGAVRLRRVVGMDSESALAIGISMAEVRHWGD
jgi:hypothetical protein